MKAATRSLMPWLMAILLWPSGSQAEELVYYSDWTRVKTATSVLQLPALQRVIAQYERNDNSTIVIRYPGGDEGSAWAEELRSWLVSLGISSSDIELQPGSGVPQAIAISAEP